MNAPYGFLVINHLSTSQIQRIFSKIQVNRETGCWEWTAYKLSGYGRLRWGKTMESAHRILYAWVFGPIPRGKGREILQLDHFACDNAGCCNPCHLKLVFPKANILRGNSAVANNARRVKCKRGHDLPTEPNIHRASGSQRGCLECLVLDKAEYHQARLRGPEGDVYRAKRLAQSRKDRQKPRMKEYQRNWARNHRAKLRAEREASIGEA